MATKVEALNPLEPLMIKGLYQTKSTTTEKFHLVVVLETGLLATCNCPGGVYHNFNGCKHAKEALKLKLAGVKDS
jgi:hypothetical protein